MALKPQDVYVVLKILAAGSRRESYARMAIDLGMSPSEVHASVKRAHASGLLHGPELDNRPNLSAVEEFLLHGLKYAFPAEHGGMTRGVATSYGASPFQERLAQSTEPAPVWPSATGKIRGISFAPLYRSAPEAALRDPELYRLLVIADLLREGRARERKMAEVELRAALREADAKIQH